MKVCNLCKERCPQSRFSMKQWFKKEDAERRCNLCVKQTEEEQQETAKESKEDGTPTINCITQDKKISKTEALETGISNMDVSNIKPPRAIDQILKGELLETNDSVIYELLDALAYERSNSTTYLSAVKQLKHENFSAIPRTFETESMISANHYFLMGPSPFSLRKLSFCNSDIGNGLLLDFKDREDNDLYPILYIGECRFSPLDLWYFAVIANKKSNDNKKDTLPERLHDYGSPEKPHHHSVLLCPFCATLLDPENDDQTYIMLARMKCDFVGDNALGFDVLYQLCCKSCFVKNLIKNDEDWGEFPGCERYGLFQNLLNSKLLPVGTPEIHDGYCPSAEMLHVWTNRSGLEKSGCMLLMEAMSKNYSNESAKYKIKSSKSLSKASGLEVMKINLTKLQKRTCFGCGINTVKTSACSKCKNTHYCSKFCQRLHWKEHKHVCSPETEVKPLPSDSIQVYTKDRYSIEERQNHENFCKSCKRFTGDSHGKEAYCFGCAKFLFCGPCNGLPKNNDGEINGGNSATPYKGCCKDCMEHLDTDFYVMYTALENLVEKDPTGIHVKHMRLCMAQMLLDEHGPTDDSGQKNRIDYAKKEIKWLANNLDYAPAQLLLGSLHDPICQSQEVCVYQGPMYIEKISKRNFYEVDIAMAKKYYERACEQKLSSALHVVGSYYESGSNPYIFQKDEAKGISMLEEATAMGHTRAMYKLGWIYFFIKKDRKKGIELLRDAAFNGDYDAMFYIGMVGMGGQVDTRVRNLGKWCVSMILQKKIPFEGEKQLLLKKAASFYENF